MATKLDSVTLFQAQIANHTDELALLLAVGPQEMIDPTVLERSLLSTTMLAKSASLMELEGLTRFLTTYRRLLMEYRDCNIPWDERIAQVTSEVIEREDEVVETSRENAGAALNTIVSEDTWNALSLETEEVIRTINKIPIEPPAPEAPAVAKKKGKSAKEPTEPHRPPNLARPDVLMRDRPLGESLHEMTANAMALLADWNESPWNPRHATPEAVADVRRRLQLVSFYAQSIDQILALKATDTAPVFIESLTPVRCAMEDFVRSLCSGDERSISLRFVGEHYLDARLLAPVVRVLQNMISDTYQRCKDPQLDIEVVVQEQNGGLFWSIRDNGSNMVSDSAVDREEYLAFYPGLRYVRQILARLHSMLWVEPSENPGTRFSFSTPRTPESDQFMVWDHSANRFAVLPNEIGDILTCEEADIRIDSRGEYLFQHGERVPLIHLGHLYEGAPSEGNLIVLVGFLEKRIAFYANGEGELKRGLWHQRSVTAWKDLRGVAQVGEEKVPLVEADTLLSRFTELFDEAVEKGVAGGDTDDHDDLSRTQAVNEKDQVSPPQDTGDVSDPEVLVVERSEALRNTLASILSDGQLRARIVDRVEDAIDCLENSAPSVIISEFRVPSMAAKVLVERMKIDGKQIPVLVTTTHQGDNAALLVQKLGAAGYISKPIDRGDVLSRLGGFVGSGRVAGKA